ncbi:MAG TPA: O-antigen ligase family protein [Bacillota bacterium]|nr:O-antigen ligase family protein [Bacillota bacterium]HPJ85485.1 O-antigen ligase family protein [Bacillota bacterium]HPQ62243.1 O-antigen ligase family protein [Bacillota bacterium]HRX91810.1 O-antigen ligase family protein [Candidatus Izemoplasmatales bacterium]
MDKAKKIGIFFSPYYLASVSLATLALWYFHLENYGIPVFLGLMFMIFILFEDVVPAVPLLLNALFMVSNTDLTFANIPLYIYLTPVVLIVGIIVHVIRFKVRFFRGKMTLGIGIMFLAVLLSTINAEFVDINYIFYMVIGVLYAFLYFFFNNSMKGDHVNYLILMMFILGLLVSAETLLYYIRVEDVLVALEEKSIDLGWGISNYIATYLIMFIPTTFYYAKKLRYGAFFIPVAAFEIVMLLFTVSRGGITAFAFVFILLVVYLFIKNKHWYSCFIAMIITAIAIMLLVYLNRSLFLASFDRFGRLLFDDSGRLDIYADAWAKFKDHPLFGNGIFARLDTDGNFRMFHNTIFHVMATMGSVGLVGLIIQVVTMFLVILKKWRNESVILAIAIFGAHLHGMVDNVYLMPQFMILLFLIIAVMENSNKANLKIE